MDPITLAAIAGMATAGGTALLGNKASNKNYKRQVEQNAANQVHEANMANVARQWSIEDWNKQNKYNSPEQQMNRLRQAGLNPHLIYGKGATHTAQAIQQTNTKPNSAQAPQKDNSFIKNIPENFNSAFGAYSSIASKKLDQDAAQQNIDLLMAEKQLKQLEIADKTIKGKSNLNDYNIAMETKSAVIRKTLEQAKHAELKTKGMQQSNEIQLTREQRAAVQHNSDIRKNAQAVINMQITATKDRQQIQNLKALKNSTLLKNELLKWQLEHKEYSDEAIQKMKYDLLGKLINKVMSGTSIMDSIKQAIKESVNPF